MTVQDFSFSDDIWQGLKERSGYLGWIKDCIVENYYPDQIFSKEELDEWAKNNGYVLKSEYESIIEELQQEIEDYKRNS